MRNHISLCLGSSDKWQRALCFEVWSLFLHPTNLGWPCNLLLPTEGGRRDRVLASGQEALQFLLSPWWNQETTMSSLCWMEKDSDVPAPELEAESEAVGDVLAQLTLYLNVTLWVSPGKTSRGPTQPTHRIMKNK